MTARRQSHLLEADPRSDDPLVCAVRASVAGDPDPATVARTWDRIEAAMVHVQPDAPAESSAQQLEVAVPKGNLLLGAALVVFTVSLALWRTAGHHVEPRTTPMAPVRVQAPLAPVAPPDLDPLDRLEHDVTAPLPPAPAPKEAPPARARAVPVPSELELLVRAQRALEASPARALHHTSRHREHYRRGALRQEREVLAIDALLRLGRIREARRRMGAFAEEHPGSAHRERLERLFRRRGERRDE